MTFLAVGRNGGANHWVASSFPCHLAIGFAICFASTCLVLANSIDLSVPLGPDDLMRLAQVRDFLGGQAFDDITQQRLNPPDGASMHWSRLVDLPIALVILLARPFLGTAGAEQAALLVVPTLTLFLACVAVARVVERTVGVGGIVIALFALTGYPYIVQQFAPTRIDHHGWQMVLAASMLASLLGARAVRSGALAGLAMAVSLQISLEGLPLAVGTGAVLAVFGLFRAEDRIRFVAYLGTLAAVSLALFAALQPASMWSASWCDAMMPGHLAALAVAALFSLPILALRSPLVIVGCLALAAAAGATAFAAVAPHCLASPFATLDPLVREIWYLRVSEGLPFWVQPNSVLVPFLFFVTAGSLGHVLSVLGASDTETRRRRLLAACLFAVSVPVGAMVIRASGVMVLFALPGLFILLETLLAAARRIPVLVPRMLATTTAILLTLPQSALLAGVALQPIPEDQPRMTASTAQRGENTATDAAVDVLKAQGNVAVLSLIDAAPRLLFETGVSVVATGHHRNAAAMRDAIAAFTGSDATVQDVLERYGVRYVFVPEDSPEADLYVAIASDGLTARLRRGETPAWLQPVETGAQAKPILWRVAQDTRG